MSSIDQLELQNRLLSRLPREDFSLLADKLRFMDFSDFQTIAEPNEPIAFLLFPEAGVISIVVQSSEGQSTEGGVVGREGFVTPSILLGTDRTPHLIEVQVGGYGYRIDVADFLTAVGRSEALRTVLLRFAHTLLVQVASTAMSNAAHSIDERLARWLLMCHDRSPSDDLALTHRFMAVMLAVRRASVTTALQTLESHGFIGTERGYVMILKRAALEAFAGDAYGAPEAEYRRLLGPL